MTDEGQTPEQTPEQTDPVLATRVDPSLILEAVGTGAALVDVGLHIKDHLKKDDPAPTSSPKDADPQEE